MSYGGGASGGPPGSRPSGFALFSDLKSSGIQIGPHNTLNVTQGAGVQTRSQRRAAASAPRVKEKKPKRPLSKSENEPSLDEMDKVCKALNKYKDTAWRDLGTKLGLSSGELDTIHHDHHAAGVYEVSYQTLLLWKQRQPTPPQVKVLAQALCDIGRGDLSDKLA
ncbi:receptor-interacting serine/threonine-protein kinase 1-like [Haliotis rubra]|uniref:receptor-interacting serine/threonine-protein kinase 1-like n=1 Tax=Haliotis rubra TaxID=36100 RepID=UPI001EE4F7D3|nr:receptor-interacting serine/threonine-protein kinase 1-like [Haliotis rubra]